MGRDADELRARGLDILGPAERRVLEYVREGTLDAEIAVRLGVPVGDVKDRVASMLEKLNLPDRAALAAWDPSQLPPPQPAAADLEFAELAESPEPAVPSVSRLSWGLDPGTVASLVAVVVLAAGALAFVLWPKEEDTPARANVPDGRRETAAASGSQGSPSPTAPPARTTPAPGVTPVRGFGTLQEGLPVTLPGTVQLLVLEPCPPVAEHCPGGGRRLSWVHWTSPEPVSFPVFEPGGEQLLDTVASADGRTVLVVTCSGRCTGQGDGQWRLHRSLDGGATWEASPPSPRPVSIQGFAGTDAIVLTETGATVYEFATNSHREYPGKPPERQFHTATDPRFSLSDDGRRLLTAEGSSVLDPRLPPGVRIVSFLAGDVGEYFVFDGQRLYWYVYGMPEAVVAVDGPLQLVYLLDPGVVLANVMRGGLLAPVMIDLNIGTMYPLDELAKGEMALIAVRQGSAEVTVTGAGDCLNVRAAPNTGAPILECLPDGSRLALGSVAFADAENPGLRWLQVGLPDGRVGYARSDFLTEPAIAIPTLPNESRGP